MIVPAVSLYESTHLLRLWPTSMKHAHYRPFDGFFRLHHTLLLRGGRHVFLLDDVESVHYWIWLSSRFPQAVCHAGGSDPVNRVKDERNPVPVADER
ncbi:MAG: hypothetical protein FGF48_09720 [Candidatus Brockarchaeota archaeon]|nr:hypothetical protein [Candidatus Brockarchaeota archaeon]